MKVIKKVIGHLSKCYSIAPLHYKENDYLLVGPEKQGPWMMFDKDGNLVESFLDGPGGCMSMVQVPGSDGVFLATQRFYSPNDSAEAEVAIVIPDADGWRLRTLVKLPFVHRFDILSRHGKHYLIAATIKSHHQGKDDWSSPGRVYASELPSDLSKLQTTDELSLTVLLDGLTKNHGYSVQMQAGVPTAVVSAEQGVFALTPPQAEGQAWDIEELLDTPTSDALLVDLNGDGQDELVTILPFHGDAVGVYQRTKDGYVPCFTYSEPPDSNFMHAIEKGYINGRTVVFIGNRQGSRGLYACYYNHKTGDYCMDEIDVDCGPANVRYYRYHDCDFLIAANRETDNVALYQLLGAR